ncbi:alcohol acetyltransferase-domain-containing protein [Cladorrhinum sp. PSN259]|nr:alcohol acetyltransferase-domain-containing protein [Cladorrhinum sp. PSN259]
MATHSATSSNMHIASAGRAIAIRPLGPSLGFYKCVVNTCRYTVPLSTLRGQPLRQILETAIANVVIDLPSLGVGIAGEDTSNPHFVALSTVQLDSHHIEYLEATNQDQGAELLRILEKQHDSSWPDIATRPPWKVTVLSYSAGSFTAAALDVAFAVHHSIADGRSTAAFHTKLLSSLLNDTSRPAQLSNGILSLTTARKFPPPLEQAVKFTQSWRFLLVTLWTELGPAWLQGAKPTTPWTGRPIAQEPCRTNLQLVQVPANTARQILAACRQHQTTLTPLLHALTLISLVKHVPAEDAEAFSSSTPIDLRLFMEHDALSRNPSNTLPFGVFVTTQNHQFGPSTLDALRSKKGKGYPVWEIAAELRGSMKKHLDGVPRDDIMSMLSWVSDWQKFWLAKLGKPRQTTWEVSNLGSIIGNPEDAAGSWQIQRSIMSQGATVGGAAIGVNVAGIVGGDICITISSQEGIVEKEFVQNLAGDLQIWLEKLSEEGPQDSDLGNHTPVLRPVHRSTSTDHPSPSPPPNPTRPCTMAGPVMARSPTCLACLRRLVQPFNASNGSPISIQTRAKSNVMRPRDQGVVVRLLKDIPKFGRKKSPPSFPDAIFRVERGRMRNEWFPNKKAEYMTAARFEQLGLSRKTDVGERDPSFGSVVVTEQYEEPKPQRVAPEPKSSSLATSFEKSHALLNILIPETLTFYRKPNPASSTTTPSGANAPLAIFGSVSVGDVINHIKGLLALDQEGSRVALEPANIQLRGLEENTDRIKTLGRFEAYISVDSSKEPVIKVIEVLPTNE